MSTTASRSTALHRAGTVVTVICLTACVVMQPVKGDWFPPEISISQYGVGPGGWLLSTFLIGVALGPVFFDRVVGSGRPTTVILLIGAVGLVVAALVPTDPGGLQQSLQAKVHMVGSALGLALIPIGMTRTVLAADRVPRAVPYLLLTLSLVSLALIGVAATGVDVFGVGPALSWTYAQCAVVVIDLTMVVLTMAVTAPGNRVAAERPV